MGEEGWVVGDGGGKGMGDGRWVVCVGEGGTEGWSSKGDVVMSEGVGPRVGTRERAGRGTNS